MAGRRTLRPARDHVKVALAALLFVALAQVANAQNRLQNGTFNTDVSGWRIFNNGGWSSEDASGSANSGSLRLNGGAFAIQGPFDVVASAAYQLGGALKGGNSVHFDVVFKDAGGTLSSTFGVSSEASGWNAVSRDITAPSWAKTAEVQAWGGFGPSTAQFFFDNLSFSGPAAPPPSITSFTAVPDAITLGESATLSWTTTNATTVTITPAVGGQPVNGSVSVSPTTTTTYTLTAVGPGGSASKTATVVVNQPPPPKITFTASQSSIPVDGTSTLTWNVTNATTVSINHGIGTVPNTGSLTVRPTQTITYRLTATGPGGTRTSDETITVVPAPVIVFFADRPTILVGQTAMLRWQVTDATTVLLDQGLGQQAPVGSIAVSPRTTTTYRLMAIGVGGVGEAEVTVTVKASRRRSVRH